MIKRLITTSLILLLSSCAKNNPSMSHVDELDSTSHSTTDNHPSFNSSPVMTLKELADGNLRYLNGKSLHANQSITRRMELTNGQHPQAIILSCSDSRVPPEIVFDKGLGELFVIRTAGEIADTAAIASIEYAVEHLHSNLIVVMGHSSCGAIKAALSTPEESSAGSPSLDSLIGEIRPAIKSYKLSHDDKSFTEPVRANVSAVAKGLKLKSKIIHHALEKREIMIVEALYHLDSGKVDFTF